MTITSASLLTSVVYPPAPAATRQTIAGTTTGERQTAASGSQVSQNDQQGSLASDNSSNSATTYKLTSTTNVWDYETALRLRSEGKITSSDEARLMAMANGTEGGVTDTASSNLFSASQTNIAEGLFSQPKDAAINSSLLTNLTLYEAEADAPFAPTTGGTIFTSA